MRGLNRHVEATAPWQLAKDDSRAAELDGVLYDLADGLRAVAIALAAYLPETAPADPRRARPAGRRSAGSGSRYGLTVAADGVEPAAPLFPRVDAPTAVGVIDTHAHLDACDEPVEALLARARAAGVTRVVTIGTGIDSCRRGARPRRRPRGRRRGARHRPAPGVHAGGRPRRRAPRAARAIRRPSRSGETGLDGFHRFATLDEQRRAARRAARARRRARAPGRDPQPRGGARRPPRRSRRSPGTVDPPLLLVAPAARRRDRARLLRLLRRATSRFRRPPTCGSACRSCPPSGSSPRPTARTSRLSRSAGARNEPANVVHTLAVLAGRARRGRRRRSRRGSTRTPRRRSACG